MVVDFLQSRTRLNLIKAFAGESQARERYGIAASFAAREGLYVIRDLFLEIADQEKEHGEIFYEFLRPFSGENLRLEADYPVDLFDSTLSFLRKASQNEMDEFRDIYSEFGAIASEEGFFDISKKFAGIAKIEKVHSEKFARVASMLENNTLFSSKNGNCSWICTKCGNVYEGTDVPDFCPICSHAKGYYSRLQF